MLHLWFGIQSIMAALYLILALFIQNSVTETVLEDDGSSIESHDGLNTTNAEDFMTEKILPEPSVWIDAFIESSSTVFPTSSAALMAQATNSSKSPEEKLEDIKEIVSLITTSLQSEMANLLSDAVSCTSNEEIDNKLRKKRSLETPMDSTQLVMRLLKHIKSNNEYQNIAIEKMMSAQEIADKYGINFTPDPDTLSDLALAATKQVEEMSAIFKDALKLKNETQNILEPKEEMNIVENIEANSNETLNENIEENQQQNLTINDFSFEIPKETDLKDHLAVSHNNHYSYDPVETQIASPPSQHYIPPVSQRPSFYDFVSDIPTLENYCSIEPATTTIILSNDDVQANPDLLCEEYEETISSKVYINHDEAPDVSTVNHVMSYTVSEKAHFRAPHIESLPQQMQYYFLLM